MDANEYQRLALLTESKPTVGMLNRLAEVEELLIPWMDQLEQFLALTIPGVSDQARTLDQIKKYVFYTKDETQVLPPTSELDSRSYIRLWHFLIGKVTELAEIIAVFQQADWSLEDIDLIGLAEEIGDDDWYNTLGLDAIHIRHGDNLETNNRKLLGVRYPGGFDAARAAVRNLAKEREALSSASQVGVTSSPQEATSLSGPASGPKPPVSCDKSAQPPMSGPYGNWPLSTMSPPSDPAAPPEGVLP